ncbi:YncE family protein [Pontibacter mangrovi]|uniref:YncE family protein n=1 Tax=Pontibacter mangrovi TaxID=2589816 RepID=A0A501W5H8_9BACT|nr:DUF5074 domain-containing protein [Pontibacter mangrovi]TPE44859.1 hypothetical protein FJM65_07510 [Pontibacter mangrovi]
MKKLNCSRSFLLAVALLASALTFTGCDNKDSDAPSGAYAEDGVFVLNEGNFRESNASISFYSNSTGQAEQSIFKKENQGRLLGDVVQDMELVGNRAFIVMNNSNKIEVVNAATFQSVGVIEGLSAPRYFVALNNEKGYVTEWFPPKEDWSYHRGRVSVIDLRTYKVVKTIEVDVQPEQLLLAGGNLYVANAGSPLVHVIDTGSDMVIKTIEVAYGPNSLVLDRNNNLWVLSSGNKDWNAPASEHTAGALSKINIANNTVTSTITFPDPTASASKLLINGDKDTLYFLYSGGVHQLSISASAPSTTPLIDRTFYGLGVDPVTGNIYGADENSFAGDGTVYIYDPQGNQTGSFKAGIGPNGFVFN